MTQDERNRIIAFVKREVVPAIGLQGMAATDNLVLDIMTHK